MNDSLKGSGIMTSELLPVFKRWLISRINGIIQKNISEMFQTISVVMSSLQAVSNARTFLVIFMMPVKTAGRLKG